MNNKKFCFITCVNDEELYSECLHYISNLTIPDGYEVETLSIENAKSITSGYNELMKNSDAKYKIYLHQDLLIVNKNILYEILNIFSDENIGMIGVCGSKIIGTDGVWWSTFNENKYGKIYEYREDGVNISELSNIYGLYEEVQAIDGILMITQYDIPWREDILKGWHHYDVSQSIEFMKQSYKVVVANQNKSWCLHDSGLVSLDNFDEAREIFLNEYGKYLFPLVSILIPTYNRPEYFKVALESAINQTYPNIEIIVGDDSTNNETEKLMIDYMNKHDNITYYHNKENIGQYDNANKLLNMCNGRYVNFLMDDDLFALNKIEKMMHYFINYKDESIAIVTSNRMKIDEKGNEKEVFIPSEIINQVGNKIFDGKFISNYVLKNNYNIIGEPTTVLFDKTKLKEEFGKYNGRRYICNVDQAAWLNLLNDNKLIILDETLSYFRIHEGQQLEEKKNILGGLKDYIFSIITSRDKGLLIDDEDYSYAIDNCLSYLDSVNKLFDLDEECRELAKQLYSKAEIINKVFSKISILMIVDDFYEQIEENIMSALSQYYCNYELIIGYKDEAIIKKMQENISKHRKVVLHKLDEKLDYKSSIKELINKSQGEYINYLSKGSKMNREMIRMLVDKIKCDKSKIAISNSVLINKNNEVLDDNTFTNLFFRCAEEPIEGNKLIEKIVYKEANDFLNMSSILVEKNILLDSLDRFKCKYEGNIEQELAMNVLEDRDVSIQLQKNVFNVVDIEKCYEEQLENISLIIKKLGEISSDKKEYILLMKRYIHMLLKYKNKLENKELINGYINKLLKDIEENTLMFPKLSIVISSIKGNLEEFCNKIYNNIYPNIEICIMTSEVDEDIKKICDKYPIVTIYEVNTAISKEENTDRALHSLDGRYFTVIDYKTYIDVDNIETMMNYFEGSNVGTILCAKIPDNKIIYDSGDKIRKYIANNINEVSLNSYSYIINRSYYINQYSTYYKSKFKEISGLSTLCNALKYGDGVIIPSVGNELVFNNINERVAYCLETLYLLKCIYRDRVFNNINEYNSVILDTANKLFEEIKNECTAEYLEVIKKEVNKLVNDLMAKGIDNFYYYGDNSKILKEPCLICPECIEIGDNVGILESSTLMIPFCNNNGQPRIIIKDGCDIGKRIFISATNKITIEENVIIAANCHITDHNHEYRNVGIPIKEQGVTSFTNEVVVGAGTWIANNCVIVGNVKIGRGCVIGANSVVNSDIPDYCVAVGSPAKVIKYFDFSSGQWIKVNGEFNIEEYNEKVKKHRPLITFGIFTYNRSGFLERSLDNIYSQIGNDKNFEVLICDNASNDATDNVINKYKDKYDNLVYCKNENNIGAMLNAQKAFELAQGEFVNVRGDDDYYSRNIIYKIMHTLYENRDTNVLFTLSKGDKIVVKNGCGINEYINEVSYVSTLLSGLFINKDKYKEVKDKNKFVQTLVNQVYLQLEMLKENNKFTVIKGPIFNNESGQHKHIGTPYNFARVFIKGYLDIVSSYLDRGLSIEVYKEEKKNLLEQMILPWVQLISNNMVDLSISNILEYFNDYYKDEEYYEEKLNVINSIMYK